MFVKTYVFLRVFRILLFYIVLLEEQTCIQKVTTKSFTTASCWCGNANHPTIINWQQHAQLAKTYSTGKNSLNCKNIFDWQNPLDWQKPTRLAKAYSSGKSLLVWQQPTQLAKAYSTGKSLLVWQKHTQLLTQCFHSNRMLSHSQLKAKI